ncbi:hypothetical protein [Paludibaculum fermentans]|uniref:Lipoprotein n=1 Tax=Paludibaculum fermentans TaxID=1473598 RepID=A0A7S7NQQ6_PALFE|nr:hypothetical protein [Paludibaculum fermentans]QOY88053.1 hypothetical protein IRI77_35850 [Paludibaculum fermentans]
MGRHAPVCLSFLIAAGMMSGCSSSKIPEFKGTVGQLDLDGGFSDFLEHHQEAVVRLDVVIPRSEFQGGSEKEFDFIDVFDTCDEVLKEGETPSAPRCQGTEYNLPKVQGRSVLVLDGGSYHLRGRFRVTKRTGPLQGMFSVQLQPAD